MDRHARIDLRRGGTMPVLGLGTWKLTDETARCVAEALEVGYRMIDTAVDYGSQPGIGAAIAGCGLDRGEIFVVTKIEEDDDPRGGVERDLSELGLDYADLTLIHRPPPDGPGEELWRGLLRAREEGLVREVGVSNYAAEQVDDLIARTDVVPAVNQLEWSPFGHSWNLLEHHRERGIVVQAYSPLTRAERLDDPELTRIAREHGKTPAQVLLRWNLQIGTVPLPKANRPGHFRENLDIFDFEIPEAHMMRLETLEAHYSALGGLPYA
ncbi:aldo/keto reductase [Roseibacterium sp. SDUM158017]|uniref:aldo/keto reductase n=1 Tax=Roseicyclus salinarum TaxID=3036773 RepID=UPI0024150234|nr:aldo/keto reductase [Roseibacterium sp. SDUM158017]MDG4647834.1 aldo/keto reductase [Roseibacterium sp. SDUM158017]